MLLHQVKIPLLLIYCHFYCVSLSILSFSSGPIPKICVVLGEYQHIGCLTSNCLENFYL